MKTAFIFPGQGSQFPGMGRDVAESFPEAAGLFEKAAAILGFDLAGICFEAPAEQLNRTDISQPAIFLTSAAILEVIRVRRPELKPAFTAGLSLGEYTALYAAGAIDFESALVLCRKRGQAMQAAAGRSRGGMVSVIGLADDVVLQLCREASGGETLVAANYNCPGQVVASGSEAACERLAVLAEKKGAIKAVRLDVAGAFHTGAMAPAAEALRAALEECRILEDRPAKTIANVDAAFYGSAGSIRAGLTAQLTGPILWCECMRNLLAEGVERFYEIGPGRVLAGLMRRIERSTKIVCLGDAAALNKFLAGGSEIEKNPVSGESKDG